MATLGEVFPPERHHELPPVDQNAAEVGRLASDYRAELQGDIESGNGSAVHHLAELKELGSLASRVSGLVREHRVATPIDRSFFFDVMDVVKTGLISEDAFGEPMSRRYERLNMWQAERSLRRRQAHSRADSDQQLAA